MADVDLLIHPADGDTAVAILLAQSYHDAGTSWKHQGFEPVSAERRAILGEHADNPIKVDLHQRICERLPLTPTDLTDVIYPPHAQPGLNTYPRAAALLAHVLAHAAGSMTHRCLRLIQLCDIARLARKMTAADWEDLARLHGSGRRLWWAAPPLILSERHFAGSIPPEMLALLSRDCPRLLRAVAVRRTVSAFSYSYLYIDPVPGLIWARSPGEAVHYLLRRVFPGKAHLAEMQRAVKTGPWSAEPRWHTQSQARRILQWLALRPTRTASLQPVRAALARAQ
jgi:hypothetical protein